MASTKEIMKLLGKIEGAVTERHNPFANVVRSPSPSLNFVFGKAHGLPFGHTLVMYGPPKGGKSVIANAMIGQLHRDDPEAVAIKYNTEMREQSQLTDDQYTVWGIDPERYMAYDVNRPDLIFDKIEKDIAALCDKGGKIKLIVIDSITGIQGRRAMGAEGIMVQNRGDEALTLGEGFKRILPTIRKHNIALILTAHIRAEQDTAEQMRGNKVRMAAAFAVQHFAEYFMMVEPNRTKKGRQDIFDNDFEDDSVKDLNEKGERTAHKIRVCMKDSSLGPKGRTGEFTLDYNKGIVNTHQEVYLLGVNRNIINKPNNTTHELGDKKWVGKPAMVQALIDDPSLQSDILRELKRRDMAGTLGPEVEEEPEEQSA